MPQLLPETVEAIKDSIEDTALKFFIRQGFAQTTTRQIAKELGYSAGAIYNHYPSKDALFSSVVKRYQKKLLKEENPLTEILQATDFPFDLPRLADAIKSIVEKHRAYWLLWYVDVIEFGGKHFRKNLAPKVMFHLPELKDRLIALRKQGTLRLEPEAAFTMVYMHFFNYFLVETVFGGNQHYGLPDKDAVEAMIDVFLNGMLNQKGS